MTDRLLILPFFGLAPLGTLLVSLVQYRIIARNGWWSYWRTTPFLTIYWRNLSHGERWAFWIGFVGLMSPFATVLLLGMTA